jgi:hypothetical protein
VDQACGECHADLKTKNGATSYAAHIRSLEDGHPQFAALRDGSSDPGTLKLNHEIHMQPIRRGPNGPVVNLECGNCHRPAAVKMNWIYADERYVAVKPSYSEEEEIHVVKANTVAPRP